MDTAGLKIVVSADLQNALRNMTKLTDATAELATEGVGNITAVNEALKELKSVQKDTGNSSDLGVINRAIKDLGKESQSLRNIGVPGFDEFGKKLKDVAPAADVANKGVLGFANSAFSSIRKLAYILPGVGIAGIFGAIGAGIVEMFSSASKEAEEATKINKEYFASFGKTAPLDTEQAKRELDSYNKIIQETVQSTGKETAQVDILVNSLQHGNLTRSQTTEAIKELQRISPEYFAKLSAEKSSIEDVTQAYNKYNQALISNIETQIHIAEITDLVKKRLDFARQTPDAAKFINDQVAAGKSLDDISKEINSETRKGLDLAAQAAAANKGNSAELEKQALLNSKIPFGTQTILKYLRDEQDLLKTISDAPVKVPIDTEKAKSIIPILEQIKRIYDEIAKPSTQPLFKQLSDSLAALDKNSPSFKLIEAQIADAISKGTIEGAKDPAIGKAYGDLVTALQAKLSHLQNPDLRAHIQGIVDVKAESGNIIQSKIEKEFGTKGLELKVPVHLSEAIDNAGSFDADDRRKIADGLEKNLGLAHFFVNARADIKLDIGNVLIKEADLKKLKETIVEVGTAATVSAFEGIGLAIGDALSGAKNPLQKAVQGFTEVLGDGLITIGKQLIVASALVQAIKSALSTLFASPAGGLVVGIAAVAAGEVIKNVGAHAFATGGIVTGPTMGLVGEAGPEVIFPLNQLNRFIKGTQGTGIQNINVTGSLSGNNIRLALARTNKQQGLV